MEMLAEVKISRLVGGFLEAEPCGVEARIDCGLAFSRFIVETEKAIAPLDINPVCVRGKRRQIGRRIDRHDPRDRSELDAEPAFKVMHLSGSSRYVRMEG